MTSLFLVYLHSVVGIMLIWILNFKNRNDIFELDPQCYLCISENSSVSLQFVFSFWHSCSSPVLLSCLFYGTVYNQSPFLSLPQTIRL